MQMLPGTENIGLSRKYGRWVGEGVNNANSFLGGCAVLGAGEILQ